MLRRARWLAAVVVSGLLASCALSPDRVAGIEIPPPLPPGKQVDTHWGTAVPDPWRHLENTKDPQVQQWLRAQADATTRVLDRIPGRDALLARMHAIDAAAAGVTSTVVRTDSGRLFFLRRNPGEDQFKLVWRDGPEGRDTVIVDPEALSKAAGRSHAILDFHPSNDGKRLAYSVQVGGGEIGTMHVVDVDSGRALTAPADRIRFAVVSWLADGSGLFYSRLREGYDKLPPGERFDRAVHFRALDGSDTDRAVFSPSKYPGLRLPTYASALFMPLAGTRLVVARVFLGVERNTLLFIADLDAAVLGRANWRRVVEAADEISNVTYRDGQLYLRSAKGAPRYRILRLSATPNATMASAELLVPEGTGVIETLAAARDGLYFTRREGAQLSLLRVPASGGAALPVSLPVQGHVEIKSASAQHDGVIVSLANWTRAAKDHVIAADASSTRLALAPDGAFDAPASIEAHEVLIPSHDGVMVPLSIIARKGLRLDGRNPVIVNGYGAYGSTEDATFNPRLLAYLESGGVFAIAHVRGGGAYGRAWHDAGKKTTKPNTWKDGIAAAEWLIAQGWTMRERVGIYGGSAGGIFVGRAITERPDLFAAGVPMVGAMDMVRMETAATGAANIPEYGSVKDEAGFRGLLAMSSYHQVKDGVRYPAVLLAHGVNDIRVDVWQSAKFASRLRQAGAGDKPVLMRLDYDGGHGSGSTRAQLQARSADVYAFFLWQFGVPEFQPRQP